MPLHNVCQSGVEYCHIRVYAHYVMKWQRHVQTRVCVYSVQFTVYMCICVHVYMCTCVHVYMCTCVHVAYLTFFQLQISQSGPW